MSQKAHFLTYILDVLSPGVKFERPENREALVQDILAWHRAALTQYGEQVREAIYQAMLDRDHNDPLQNPLAIVRNAHDPPIEEGEAK